ncbi:hypothetical protein RHGRI_027856 [Rhododendron griersonianum]|uniref:beta-carotene 3-hydroxylase n=1 Tax=Rhododendron griersonianum TaxID=479676 RepID=A0AAV6J2K9_9ERIC|nr:hypothetical protein RHGRI_027856 [Rhododendron griersonianum]
MLTGISTTTSSRSFFGRDPFVRPKPNSITTPTYLFSLPIRPHDATLRSRRRSKTTVCFVVRDEELNNGDSQIETPKDDEEEEEIEKRITAARVAARQDRKKSERFTYLVAAVMSSLGGNGVLGEMGSQSAVARFLMAHARGNLSHHKAREGPFELNDVFAVINAAPAIALLSYGFFHKGLFSGLCFGALHHTDKFKGVPYGLFLGPKELEEVGGNEELEKEINRRIKLFNIRC